MIEAMYWIAVTALVSLGVLAFGYLLAEWWDW